MILALFAALITLPMKWKLTISIMYIVKQPGETVSSGQCYYSLMSMQLKCELGKALSIISTE